MNLGIIRRQAKQLLGLTIIAASMFHSRVQALPVVLQSAVNPANSHTYYLLDNSNWTDAESAAGSQDDATSQPLTRSFAPMSA